jgi:Ala-tRNA(Pro) deacylase
MMPADKHFATRPVSDQVGSSRLGFADESYLLEFLDITPGSVSVLGLMNDKENRVQLLMDEDILAGEYFGCHPCINTTSLRIKTKDLIEKILPAMGHTPKIVHLD